MTRPRDMGASSAKKTNVSQKARVQLHGTVCWGCTLTLLQSKMLVPLHYMQYNGPRNAGEREKGQGAKGFILRSSSTGLLYYWLHLVDGTGLHGHDKNNNHNYCA